MTKTDTPSHAEATRAAGEVSAKGTEDGNVTKEELVRKAIKLGLSAADINDAASDSMEAARDALYSPTNYRPPASKVGDLKTLGWTKWNSTVKGVWKQHLVFEVGVGLRECPRPKDPNNVTDTETQARQKWQAMDERARYYLEQGISGEYMHLIRGTNTAAQAYEALSTYFGNDPELAPSRAMHALATNRWDPGSGVPIRDNLAWIRSQMIYIREYPVYNETTFSKFADLMEAMYVITSLPPEWEPVRDLVNSSNKMDLESVTRICLRKEASLTEAEANPNVTAAAVKALKAKGKASNRSSIQCENCTRRGHRKADCWAKGGGKEGQGPKQQKGSKSDTKKGNAEIVATVDVEDRSDSDESVNIAHVLTEPTLATFTEQEWAPFPRKGEFTSPLDPDDEEPRIAALDVAAATPPAARWLFDTAAGSSLTGDRSLLTEYHDIAPLRVGGYGEGMDAFATGKGQVELRFSATSGNSARLIVGNVLLVKQTRCNIISAGRVMAAGVTITGDRKTINLYKGDQLLGTAIQENGQFVLQTAETKVAVLINSATVSSAKKLSPLEWHRRLGHLNMTYVRHLVSKQMVNGMALLPIEEKVCTACLKGKSSRQFFPQSDSETLNSFDLIHSDVCGPMRTQAKHGHLYVLTVTDDLTRFSWVYFLKDKASAYSYLEEFLTMVETQFKTKVSKLRTDQGGEFLNDRLRVILTTRGILHQTTNAYTPQQNGVAERLNRTLGDKVRCIYIDHPDIPQNIWPNVYRHANHLRNLSPTSAVKWKTPWEALYGTKPDVSHLRPFWDKVIIHIPTQSQAGKLAPRGFEAHFLGFRAGLKGILYYQPSNGAISTSRDYVFVRDPTNDDDDDDDRVTVEGGNSMPNNNPNELIDAPAPPAVLPNKETSADSQKGKRTYVRKEYGAPTRASARLLEKYDKNNSIEQQQQQQQPDTEGANEPNESTDVPEPAAERAREEGTENSIIHYAFANVVTDESDPIDYKEAISGPNRDHWIDSMHREIGNLQRLDVYELCSLPQGRKAVGSRWVYKIKRDPEGKPKEFKSRLVAQGFTQKYLVDYDQVHAPVARTSSFKLLAVIAAYFGLQAHQLDVKAAFLHGELEEEIYMRQPPGFSKEGQEELVLKLKKSIYGLKQSGRVWNKRFDKELRSLGFSRLQADPCVYLRKEKEGHIMLGLHVDDIEFFAPSDRYVTELIGALAKRDIELVHIGPLTYMLGVNFSFDRQKKRVLLNQHGYIDILLDRFGMSNAKPAKTPFPSGTKLSIEDSPSTVEERNEMQKFPFHALIGSLLYLAIWTRPDLAYHVNALAQFTSNPGQKHWKLGTHVLRYLKETRDLNLTLGATAFPFQLIGYADADWGSSEGRKSITGYLFSLGHGAITWQSKKQPTVALSSAEAEYMALSAATQECLWLRTILSELGFPQREPTLIHSDNQGAISLSSDSVLHQRVKHIDIRHHFIRDHVERGDVKASFLRTEDQPADALTKLLSVQLHSRHTATLGLIRP